MTGINGLNAYRQTNQVWNEKKLQTADSRGASATAETAGKTDSTKAAGVNAGNIKTNPWKPIDLNSSLVPTQREGIGTAIGDVQLSDKAKDYYSKLKAKFGNMEFIAVSKDMKELVKSHASAYGNSGRMVVLIDDEKLERMAEDESFRNKYEGIIAMSQMQLQDMKNSLSSTGAGIKNFGISVDSNGERSYFATLEKSSNAQKERIEKKQAEKKAAKVKEKKQTEKEAKEKRLEKQKEEKKAEEAKLKEDMDTTDVEENMPAGNEAVKYMDFRASSMEDLVNRVSRYAYNNSANSVLTAQEKQVGQHFDFRG